MEPKSKNAEPQFVQATNPTDILPHMTFPTYDTYDLHQLDSIPDTHAETSYDKFINTNYKRKSYRPDFNTNDFDELVSNLSESEN